MKKKIEYITQTELAKRLGVTLQSLQYYVKNGTCASLDMYGKKLVDSSFKIKTQ